MNMDLLPGYPCIALLKAYVMQESRLFIVANRLPLQVRGDGANAQVEPVSGGLVSAIRSYLNSSETCFSQIFWAGVPGCNMATWKQVAPALDESTFRHLPVPVPQDLYEKYYNGFSNSVIWPLFHYFPSLAIFADDEFAAYMAVNRRFAECLARICGPGDTIWIHDYHLLPLAGMLRSLVPEVRIGFFLHIPFPTHELFRLIPRAWQKELLEGLLGADLIGFHTMDYATHFLECVHTVLGTSQDKHILRHRGRLIKVDVFPISIDYALFNNAFELPEVREIRQQLQSYFKGCKVIFSVDRLDYTKGVHNRLLAYEQFLRSNPEYHQKVIFVLAVVPSRDKIPRYAERKKMIDERVARINSEIGDIQWQPVTYMYSHLPFEKMIALYTLCDVALITPMRDGMNLVSKEFVASRADRRGVLILSEMAGAARELKDALIINPNDTSDIAEKIREALELTEKEQERRMVMMQRRISFYHVAAWAEDFMTVLDGIQKKQMQFQEIFLDLPAKQDLFNAYQQAQHCIFLLDYDGTLVPFSQTPEQAIPDLQLILLLGELAGIEGHELFVISGRNSQWLEQHFGELPIHLIAEHGAMMKLQGQEWHAEVQTHSDWKSDVHHIMEMYERRCAHSFIEEKEFSIVWHYRNADAELGELRAAELIQELEEHIGSRRLEVIPGDKIIEVRNCGINKGTAIRKILSDNTSDFVFAAGDDRTDEDMFKTLVGRPNCFTIKVGPNRSFAQYNVMHQSMIRSLLIQMKRLKAGAVRT